MNKQLLLLMMLLSAATKAFAVEEVEIDGLWYEVVAKAKVAKVIQYKNNVYCKGDIVIPETVVYEGVTYSVTSIGDYAFNGCSLTSVTIPNSVTSIGYGAFLYCSGLTSVTIGNSVTSIGEAAFYGCTDLTSVNIPNSVTSIGEEAFRGCFGLTSITIPNSVTSIGNEAFEGCSGLTSVTIPNSVTSIGDYAFNGSGLTSVTIGNSVTSIGKYAFKGCGLTSVTIPNSVTSIGYGAFSDCSGLKKVIVKDIAAWCGISFSDTYSNPLYWAQHLYSDENTEITELLIPNSVTSIESCAFAYCSGLTAVVIGGGVETIKSQAFANCPDLTDVTCYAENVPSTQSDAFKGSYIEYVTLHVPQASVSAYQSTIPWNSFGTIVPLGNYYQLSITVGNHGSVSYNNQTVTGGTNSFNLEEGSDAILIITPDAGYQVSTLTVNGEDAKSQLSNGMLTISNVTANATVVVTFEAIPGYTETIKMAVASGDRTAIGYSSSNGLDFTNVTDVKAWIVTGFTDEAAVLLSRVKIVPPNTGLYLTSDVAGVEVDVPTTDKDIFYANLLKAAVDEETIQPTETHEGVEYTNFVVGKLTNGEMGFVRVKTARTLGPNKSRLLVPSSYYPVNAPSLSVEFIDETSTDIKDCKDEHQQSTDYVFDLQGRKLPVGQAHKGMYIYKGKKYVIK